MSARGLFITFEGGDGVGKTTQIRRMAARFEALGREVLMLREPGSTPIGEQVRGILLDPANTDMDPLAELVLYEAARAQMVNAVVRPALAAGKVVLCDRFTDSTMAYQGFARGLGEDVVAAANRLACGDLEPDRTFLLERDQAKALAAARELTGGDSGGDRIESEPAEFHARVAAAFSAIAEREPARVRRIAVSDDADETERRIMSEMGDLLDGSR